MKKFLSMLVAILASISISASNGFTVSSVSSISSGKKIMLWTDLHVMNPALLVNAGNAWQNYLASDRKMVDKSWEIFDGMVDFALAEKPDMLLVAGDLTKDGEKQSHAYVATGLQKLVDAGIQVYVVPGNHDRGTNSNAVAYDGDVVTPVEVADDSYFEQTYATMGYQQATARDEHSLSYIVKPFQGLTLLCIDSRQGKLADGTLLWAYQQAVAARKAGEKVIAMMHHGLIEHFYKEDFFNSTALAEYHETIKDSLLSAGVHAVFTGHFHTSDIAKDYVDSEKNSIYDISTGSLISYPCDFRDMVLSDDLSTLTIQTRMVTGLASESDFSNYAKGRFQSSVRKIFEAQNPLSASMKQLMASSLETIYDRLIEGATLQAEGNENLNERSEAVITDLTATLGAIKNLLGESAAMFPLFVYGEDMIASMLTDQSPYLTDRVNVTNDRELSIALDHVNTGITSIADTTTANSDDLWYTVQGVRVQQPTRAGVYVKNGKKLLVK
jgi:hypothetical protein